MSVAALVLLGSLAVGGPSAVAEEVYPRPSGTTWTFQGHGYGHGIGLSQYGALGGATAGATWQQIVGHYYAGTNLASIGSPTIRVRVASLGSSVQALPATGLRVTWDLTNSSVLPTTRSGVTIARWRIVPAAKVVGTKTKFRLEYLPSGSSTWAYYGTASVPSTGAFLNNDSGTVTTLRSGTQVVYRGQVRGTLIGSAGVESLVPVVALPLESYLLSVVPNEAIPSWPQAALSAQAVAARSFAEHHRRYAPISPSWYDVYDDTRSQVFAGTMVGGVSKEFSSTTAAVRATAGQALWYSGAVAFTQFSSSSGGWTATGSQPYLAAVRDDWDAVAANPHHTWETAVPVSRFQSAYPSIGVLTGVRVTSRNGLGAMGGRVLGVVVEGTDGSVSTTGEGIRFALGLKSSWFTPAREGSAPSYPRDVTGDGVADVLAIEASGGALRVYPTNGAGGWQAALVQESGWTGYAKALTAGTWDGDAISDVVVQDAQGVLYVRRGLGNGAFARPGVPIGAGWTVHDTVLPVGDFDGDGFTDLIARRADGVLFLYSGNGSGGFATSAGRQIGSGWNIFTAVFSPGDFDGDAKADLLARTSDGTVYLYRGNGAGGWILPRLTVATGWSQYTALTSPGDFTGDGKADVLARTADSVLWVIPGDGLGAFTARVPVGKGWNIFSSILL